MLKERSDRTLMRGGGGERCSAYQSGDLIMEGVRRAGHRFKMDKRTPGDGNCFPRAAKQQCDRQAVEINSILRHIGLLEADKDKIRKIRPKGTHVRMLYVPREVDLADGRGERSDPSSSARSTSLGTYSILT